MTFTLKKENARGGKKWQFVRKTKTFKLLKLLIFQLDLDCYFSPSGSPADKQ